MFGDDRLDAAGDLLRDGVTRRLWPGAVAAVGVGAREERRWVLGAAQDWSGGHAALPADAVFDLASLTKVLVTAPAILLLADVRLDDPVARWIPDVDDAVLIRHLLTHTSGLPSFAELTAGVDSPAALVRAAARTAPTARPGTVVTYSDAGFILLGGVVEAVTGTGLASFADRAVLGPLGSRATFTLPVEWLPRTAATEVVDGRAVLGRVHDEKAAAAGGATGHAGLFGTVDDVIACLPPWWRGGALLDDDVRADALRDHTDGLGGHRGLGWTCRGDRHDILSPGWGPDAVSHTGFTGTSMALDPVTQRWAVLLTNQVHYGRGRSEVFVARRAWHELLATG